MRDYSSADLYLDIGSTSIKWKTGDNPAIRTTAFPLPFRGNPPYYEVDGNGIYAVVENVIRTERPKRLFLSVQMHGYVLLKRGECVTGYVSWRDERGASQMPEFSLTAEYGVGIKPNLPRLSLQTQTVEADEFCTLGSFLVRKLTGNNRTHITDAAASGFYNVRRRTQDECAYALPQASYCVEEAGVYNGCAVFTPVGDMQAAVLGGTAGMSVPRAYLLNLGTAGQLCALSDEFTRGEFESRPFFHGKTLCTVTRIKGGDYLMREGDEDTLFAEYAAALKRLPAREEILVMGGAANYHREKLERVLKRLALPYRFCEGGEALNGLKILSEECL